MRELPVRGTLVAAWLLLVSVLATGAMAQVVPSRIVQATDGTPYFLKDGSRYAIVGDPIGDDELATYADGGPTGAGLLLGAVTTPPAEVPVSQPLSTPAEVPVSQPLSAPAEVPVS